MFRGLAFLIAIAAPGALSDMRGQSAADTLPERVIDRAYAAFNRHDPEAFLSNFAETWWYSTLGDTAAAPQRNERAAELKAYRELDAFRNRPTIRLVRRLVAGPYVVDLQSRGRDSVLRLDIFEVRNGMIVREWESGPLTSGP